MLDLEYAENTMKLHTFQSIGKQVMSVGKLQTFCHFLYLLNSHVLISCCWLFKKNIYIYVWLLELEDTGDGVIVQPDLFHLVPNSWGYYESTSRDLEDNIRGRSSSPRFVQCTNINGVTVIIAFMHEEVHFLRYLEGLREMKRRISTLWLTKDGWKISF